MPKITNKASGKASKSITDFFTRQTRTSSQQTRTQLSQSPITALGKCNTQKSTKEKQEDGELPSMPPLKLDIAVSPAMSLPTPGPDMPQSPRRSARNAVKPVTGQGFRPSPISSIKQVTASGKPAVRAQAKVGAKRKKKFQDDSDVERRLDSVVTVAKRVPPKDNNAAFILTPSSTTKLNAAPCPVTPISHKRPRLSSPERTRECSIVPSSQSDEMEMDVSRLSIREVDIVKESIDAWRQDPHLITLQQSRESSVSATLTIYDDSDRVSVISASSSTSRSAHSTPFVESTNANTSFTSEDVNSVFTSSLTPPPSSPRVAPRTASPVPLTVEDKTAQIIAQIKARCEGQRESSEEPALPEFKETLDSDSDDDLEELPSGPTFARSKSGPSRKTAPAVSSSSNKRYDLRSQRTSPPMDTPVRPRRNVPAPIREPTTTHDTKGKGKAKATAKGRPAANDPLEALLKEKRLADKKGKGEAALRAAESAVAGKKTLLEEMDGEDPAWLDEGAAFSALKYRDRLEKDFSSPDRSASDEQEVVMEEQDQQRLFGEKCGKTIKDILDSDKAKLADSQATEKMFGIRLWLDPTSDQMDVEVQLPIFLAHNDDPIMVLLSSALSSNDTYLASILLETAPTSVLSGIVSYLCQLALSNCHSSLGASAYRALRRLWSGPERTTTALPVSSLHSAIAQLGADPAVVQKAGVGLENQSIGPIPDSVRREIILRRLLQLVISSVRFGQCAPQEIPDILLVLFSIALDVSCSPEISRDVIVAVHAVCSAIAKEDDIEANVESTICSRVLNFISDMQPINKAHIIHLLTSGSGRSVRIARWVAYSVILGKTSVPAVDYSELPPLLPLVKALLPAAEEPSPTSLNSIFQIHAHTDYVDMGFYVQILAAVLSGVHLYAEKEKEIAKKPELSFSSLLNSPGRIAEKPDTPLQLIKAAIEFLHSRIADTRAAHLDRSRTKAALKQLSMRVHYQHQAALSSLSSSRRRTIQQYFSSSCRT